MVKYSVRKVNKKDSKEIWEIRNHFSNRKNFNNPNEILWEDHEIWFGNKYFSDKNNQCFILEDENNKVIGYCRFDFEIENNFYIISIAINPNNHNQGLGGKLLSESLKNIENNYNIFAKVHKNNIPSLKLFEKNNFRIYEKNDDNYCLKYEIK